MDLNKISKQLDKIQRTVTFLAEEDDWTQVEKDLLLEYVRGLYAVIEKQSVTGVPIVEIPAEKKEVVLEKEVEVVPEVEPIAEEPVVEVEEKMAIPEELASVFSKKEASDLGDKLSLTPIADLTKAMSINERIFTVNELFGGDQGKFNSDLAKINGLDSYETAVEYINEHIAIAHDWANSIRIKKAEKFMLLVQRRFA